MKIVDISSTILKSYEFPNGGYVLVRLRTDKDVEGIGESFVPTYMGSGEGNEVVKAIIDKGLKRIVVGKDLMDVECIWESMYRYCYSLYDIRGLAIHAISGVDMAIYDALGKTLGVPVHKLIGGSFRERVKVYVSSVFVNSNSPNIMLDEVSRYVKQGFKAIKFSGWRNFGEDIEADIRLLRSIRETAGDNVDLMLDLGRPRSVAMAIRIANRIERSGVNIYWWEEPLSRDDLEGYTELSRAVEILIAAGEGEMTRFGFKDMILRKAVDILQVDLSWVGGLTEGKRIAEMTHTWHMPLVPHDWGMAVNMAASLHLVASMPDGFLCEFPITPRSEELQIKALPEPVMTELAKEPFEIDNGYAKVPQKPGLGIELNEKVVEEFTYES